MWHREKKAWRLALMTAKSALGIPRLLRPVRLYFRCFEGRASRDLDNIYGGARKILIDAMKQAGILQDDTQTWVRGFGPEDPLLDRKDPRIEVEIVEL